MVILIAVLGLVVVNAMKESAWATSTVAATVPIAMLVGLYMTLDASGPRAGGSVIGIALMSGRGLRRALGRVPRMAPAVRDGRRAAVAVDHRLRLPRLGAAGLAAARAARLPVRPSSRSARSRCSRVGIVVVHPPTLMPPLTQFIDGTGPVVRRQGLSLRLHHHRLRRDLRLPFADRLGHDAQDARARESTPA